MPLQIRRGLEAERTQITPTNGLVEGELLYVTDQKKLYIGSGSVGEHQGVVITGYTNNDAKDAAAEIFADGEHTGITFTYDSGTKALNAVVDVSAISGPLVADALQGSVFADDSSLLVDAIDKRFFGNLTGDVKGSVFGDDSTTIVDAVNNTLNGNLTGNVVGDVTGNLTGDVTGNLTGNLTGNVVGDVSGSVFADNSTMLVDAVSGTISWSVISNVPVLIDVGSIDIQEFNGTVEAPSALSITDLIGTYKFSGYNGTQFQESVSIESIVNDVIIGGKIPSEMSIFTTSNTGTKTNSLIVRHNEIFFPDRLASPTFSWNGSRLLVGKLARNPDVTTGGQLSVVSTVHEIETVSFTQHHETPDASNVTFFRSRGTYESLSSVQFGDEIAELAFVAWDGTARRGAANISVTVSGAVSTGIVPTNVSIGVLNSTGSAINAAVFTSEGVTEVNSISSVLPLTPVKFNAIPQLPTYADVTAAAASVNNTPINGMMYYDTALGKIRAYASGSWVDLH
jgi:hypothetical protein